MNRRKTQRFIIGVVLLGLVILGYTFLRQLGRDPDPGRIDTTGWIAALRQTREGTQAVLIKPDGSVVPSPGYRPGARDRSLAWRGDGNRLFFISDRDPGSHIYRWNPALEIVERRTTDKGSKSALDTRQSSTTTAPTILVTAGGRLMDFNPRTGKSIQILPPGGAEPVTDTSEGAGGSVSAFEALYQRLGTAFKTAKWSPDRKWIVFTMTREKGELLAIQDMTPKTQGGTSQLSPPISIESGDRIDFDIADDGTVVYSLQEFSWLDPNQIPPEFLKGAVATRPYAHVIAFFNLSDPQATRRPILLIPEGKNAPGDVALSPDGTKLVVQAGTLGAENAFKTDALVMMPVEENGAQQSLKVADGNLVTPSWSPDSQTIFFARVGPTGSRIEKVSASGGSPTVVGPENANLVSPIMSPARGSN